MGDCECVVRVSSLSRKLTKDLAGHVRARWTVGTSVLRLLPGTSSVQFSSVQFSSNGVHRRSSLPDPSGASDREGTARRNWHGWTSGADMVWLPQCRASSARGPPLMSLGVLAFGLDMAVKAAMAAGAAAARALEGVTECAPHPDHAPSHACVCARDTGACNMPWVQQRRCLHRTLIRLHPLYTIPGDPHVPPRATRALYTSRGDTHAPDMKPP
jgi:hypothetical protein